MSPIIKLEEPEEPLETFDEGDLFWTENMFSGAVELYQLQKAKNGWFVWKIGSSESCRDHCYKDPRDAIDDLKRVKPGSTITLRF